jgi:dTDP-4-amino-4,6-dideoxygalactose transaminase
MQVPLLDLKAQYATIHKKVEQVIQEVVENQLFILGEKVVQLEEAIAHYVNAKYAVGVASGTDALLLSLMALEVGGGDKVITTPYTFFATAGSISRVGAEVVFVDIDPETYNMDPEKLEECLAAMPSKEAVKAIIPIHLYGQCADMESILSIARQYDIPVVEDAAQAIGACYHEQKAGSLGTFGCFSFFPSKNLGGFGDGGMVTTSNENLAETVRILRVHGSNPKYVHKMIGCNSRLDALQAAVLLVKLQHLDRWTEGRRENARYYESRFAESGLHESIKLPKVSEGNYHIYNQFVVRSDKRDELREFLGQRGIGTEIYYPIPLHLQQCYQTLGYTEGTFPQSEKAAEETLALPIYAELTDSQQDAVVEKVREFYRS